MAQNTAQLSFFLFDSTSLSSGFVPDGFFDEEDTSGPTSWANAPEIADENEEAGLRNFRLAGDRQLARGWKVRARDNLAAMQLAAAITAEHRAATSDEQEILSRFVGFGAEDLADVIFRRAGEGFKPGWEEMGVELETLVARDELASLKRSTQYAHYTPEFVIRAIWDAVERMGFEGGNILEPGCGTGLFFALMPEQIARKSQLTGIEMDPTAARVAHLLFPDAVIRNEDFTKARLADRYHLVIGNPPFSDRKVKAEDVAGRLHLGLHDYFIARSIERLLPGGIAAFVTSRYTMDKSNSAGREHIAGMANLIGAIRLPRGALAASSGTEVIVDILFFQKREPLVTAPAASWLDLAEVLPAEDGEEALSINRYFLDHPEMVLGRHERTSSAFGPTYSCAPHQGAALPEILASAATRVATSATFEGGSKSAEIHRIHPEIDVGTAAEGATIREGSYLIHQNELMQIEGGTSRLVQIRGRGGEGIPAKHARIIRHLIPIRDAVREILRAQEGDQPWRPAQIKLRVAYGRFVREFGPINLTHVIETVDSRTGDHRETFRYPNLSPFMDDPDVWLVSSIENYDVESGTAKQGPIFSERVIQPPAAPIIHSAADALAVTLHEIGHVDIDHIAELLGQSRDEVIAELGNAIYLNPGLTTHASESWETADAYLSGPVRSKLKQAQEAAQDDPRYERNVAALQAAQPEDLKPSDITARLGAPWIPTDVVTTFCEEVIGVPTWVRHVVEIASWTVNVNAFSGHAAGTSEWGTHRRHAGLLLTDALNNAIPAIYDLFIEDGKERRELNAEETEAAKEKLQKIKSAFEGWIWTDAARVDRLARIYNDTFNNLVPRHFDGGHLTLPGASNVIKFYPHQKRVIWRIISAGSTYVAHSVGAGKTFSMAAAIMEQKRLGLISCGMMAVPGHCLAQASREFLLLYPLARILVADETNFEKKKRQRFLARAATANWDCIIITHSAFKFISTPPKFERALIQHQLDSYSDLLEKVDGSDRFSRKRIERMKEGLEAKLEDLTSHKDDLVTLGELGVDQIIVDEAQQFRKLSFATNMSTLKGVDPDGSQRAWDLFVKTRYLEKKNPGRALIMASGTPITNTLGEMFTVQRYMQPQALTERGIHEFDAWAATFGETRTELELQPSGQYKPETRFSEFVNVADLMAMYRSFADVVLKSDLRNNLKLPSILGGKRQIVTADATPAFKGYQKMLGARIKAIRERTGKVSKGDDILLSVITDGRHAAIDLRFVLSSPESEPENKLNLLIANVHRIWTETSQLRYSRSDGIPYALPGGAQMIFSDLGTLSVEASRGFSAYRWIKDQLVERGVPAAEIAFMQDYKKSSAKQRLFTDVNSGKIRILIGSTETMGTGVNAQRRLKALHHLDVPWLPSDIEQREGRIERQGNENDEIELYAYATKGSVDATGWQMLERKARFIDMAMAGDRHIRRLEDAGSTVNQFAMAKAIASGDPRLMQKAGVEAEIARLERQYANHFDDQYHVRRSIAQAKAAITKSAEKIEAIGRDIERRVSTRGDDFTMEVEGQRFTERKGAGAALLPLARKAALETKSRIKFRSDKPVDERVATIGGFDIRLSRGGDMFENNGADLYLERDGSADRIKLDAETTPLGLVSRIEHMLTHFEIELAETQHLRADAQKRLPGYQRLLGTPFAFEAELRDKRQELADLDKSLAATEDPDAEIPAAAAA